MLTAVWLSEKNVRIQRLSTKQLNSDTATSYSLFCLWLCEGKLNANSRLEKLMIEEVLFD